MVAIPRLRIHEHLEGSPCISRRQTKGRAPPPGAEFDSPLSVGIDVGPGGDFEPGEKLGGGDLGPSFSPGVTECTRGPRVNPREPPDYLPRGP
jgi:hypothetical protein